MNSKLKQQILNIHLHNESYFNNIKSTEKIDFSKTLKLWGTDVIPKEFWIDKSKKYKTNDGKIVEIFDIVLENSVGNEVTYPVKGAYLKREVNKKDKWINAIWTLDGRISLLKEDIEHHFNLVEIK